MNLPGFSTSYYSGADGSHLFPEWWDRAAETTRDVLFSGKFNSMFSFLFGVGFTIQLERLMRRQPERAAWIYLRRLLILMVFGLLHWCLIWRGDVLHMYALLGLLLLLIRRIPDRAVIAIVICGLLYPAVSNLVYNAVVTPEDVARVEATSHQWELSNNAAYGAGSTWIQAVAEQTRELIKFYTDRTEYWFLLSFYVQLLTTLMLGFLAGRNRWIQEAPKHLALIRRIQWWALGIGVVAGLVFGIGEVTSKPLEPSPLRPLYGVAYSLCRLSLMVFYVSTILRLAVNPVWERRFQPIGAVGRMPLTNYLLQSVIGTFLFYGWGLGLWGKVGPAIELALAFVIFFVIQVPLSRWWFARFSYGPMEYLWRLLTYGRRPAASAAGQSAVAYSQPP